MTRALLIFVALLALLTSTTAQAQICIDFDPFCDGLELTVTGHSITGTWINAGNCDGGEVPVVGVVYDGIDNPCRPENGKVGVACEGERGCELFGDDWYFVFNERGGTVDLGHSEFSLPPPGACWLDDIEYDVILGPCPFFGERSGKSLLSTVQAGR